MSTIHRNNYDFLRLLAALAVVVQHATAHLDATFLWLSPGGAWWFYNGVAAFFIISGLFVFRSAERLHERQGGWFDFYLNRALRIIPAIWAYLAVSVVAAVVIGEATPRDLVSGTGLKWIASSLVLIPTYTPGFLRDYGSGSVNGSLWTIPTEVTFYVVVPLLVIMAHLLGGRRFLTVLLTSSLALWLAGQMVSDSTFLGNAYGSSFAPYLWFFGLGIWWNYHRDRISPHGPLAITAALLHVGAIALGNQFDAHGQSFMSLVAAIPLSYLIVWLGEYGPTALRRFTDRVGDLSFGVYIWHMPVINLMLWAGLREELSGTRIVLIAMAASAVLALLSWHLVERPVLKRKRRSSRAVPVVADAMVDQARPLLLDG